MSNKIIAKMLAGFFLLTNCYAFNLVGAWKLLALEKQDHKHWVPACYSPQGLLIYTNTGYMSASVNCMSATHSQYPSFADHDSTFYAGTYSVKNDEVTHHVNYSSSSQYYGKNLLRKIQIINEKTMNLIVKNSKGELVRLTWLRT